MSNFEQYSPKILLMKEWFIMLTKRQQQAINTKQHITISTMALLNEKDYNDISIKDICDKANISVGSFYHYFKTKDDILENTAVIFDMGFENKVGAKLPENPLDAMWFLINLHLKYTQLSGARGISALYRYNLISDSDYFVNHNRYLSNQIKELAKRCKDDGIFKCDMTPEEIRNWILRTLRGVIYDWCLNVGSYNLIEQGKKDIDVVIKALYQ